MLEWLIWGFALPVSPLPLEIVLAAQADWRNPRWAGTSMIKV
jgi:hypothetical protein